MTLAVDQYGHEVNAFGEPYCSCGWTPPDEPRGRCYECFLPLKPVSLNDEKDVSSSSEATPALLETLLRLGGILDGLIFRCHVLAGEEARLHAVWSRDGAHAGLTVCNINSGPLIGTPELHGRAWEICSLCWERIRWRLEGRL